MKDQSYPVIKFSSLFSRQRKLASPEIKIAFRDSLELFVEDMNHPQLRNHMLRDRYAGYRSINVTEDWRAIFKIHLAEGRKIEPETLIQEYMADLPSRRSEVALESSWLRRSDNRSLYEQQTLVRDYQRQLQKRIPDVNHSIRNLLKEAEKFGIPYCVIENSGIPDNFLSSQNILITHIQKVFNGNTIFGIKNRSVDVGAIILDDSNPAELSKYAIEKEIDLLIGGVKERPIAYKLGFGFCDHNHERKEALAGFVGMLNFVREVHSTVMSPVWKFTRGGSV